MTQPPQNPGQPWNTNPQQPSDYPQQPGGHPQQPGAQAHGQPQGDPYAQQPGGQPYGQPQGDPYAQQPGGQPQGDPYAQQGDPYAQHGYSAAGAQAFPEKPKKGGIKNILYGILAVVLVVGGGWAIITNMQKQAALEVGKCLVFKGEAKDADHDEVKCDDASKYSYLVAKVTDGATSCGADYAEYTLTSERRGNTKTNKTVCLIPNFLADTCYKETPSDVNDYAVVDCKEAEFKVTKVENSATADCPDSEPWSWTEPARTYCLSKP